MLKSMTAFGRASLSSTVGRFVVEIQSVNRKFLEINLFLPKELSRFDGEIKKWISTQVERGQITVKLSAHFETSAPVVVTPNLPLVRQIVSAWKQIASDQKLSEAIDLQMISNFDDVLCFEENSQDEALYRESLHQVVLEALQAFIKMREVEGAALAKDLSQRLENLRSLIRLIEAKAPDSVKKYRQKLIEKIEELLPGRIENEERILREIALYAEKTDVAEEITRFHSHLDQFSQLMHNKEGSVGKTLEFLVQELGREINTIGSKSLDASLAHLVVDVKSELERIREQIQNIE